MSNVILRKFWLENESGDSIPLNGEMGIWLIDPTGLGVNNNSSFTNFSNGFFRTVDADKDPQQTIAGDLYFIDSVDPYAAYRRFADWIVTSKTITLVYQPSSTHFRRRIRLSYLTKTELTTQECLKVPIAMYGLTPWYRVIKHTIEETADVRKTPYIVGVTRLVILDDEEEQAPESTIEDDFSLITDGDSEDDSHPDDSTPSDGDQDDSKPDGSVLSQPRLVGSNRYVAAVDLFIKGHLPAGFSIRCRGPLINPTITVRGASTGTLYGYCSLSGVEFNNSEVFDYSSNYDDSHMAKNGIYGTSNLLNNIDYLNSTIYPKIPITETCRLELSSNTRITSEVNIVIYEYYRGV